MKVEQISIFLENKPGSIEGAMAVLAEADINIRALSLADTTDFGILRLIVNDVEKARNVLHANHITVGITEVVAVEVPDRPGGLHGLLNKLSTNSINVEYMYAFVEKQSENAVMIFRFDDLDRAISVLQQGGVTVLTGDQVYGL